MGHTQNAISDKISQELKLPVRVTRQVLQKFLDIAADDIVYTGKLKLRGLGTFEVTTRPSMTIPHPVTGVPIYVPRKKVLRFRTSSTIRKRLNKKRSKKS